MCVCRCLRVGHVLDNESCAMPLSVQLPDSRREPGLTDFLRPEVEGALPVQEAMTMTT